MQREYEEIVKVTDAAAAKLREYIKEEKSQKAGVRIIMERDSRNCLIYGLETVDRKPDGHIAMEQKGVRIYFDAKNKDDLKGTEIQYLKSAKAFKVINTINECGPSCDTSSCDPECK